MPTSQKYDSGNQTSSPAKIVYAFTGTVQTFTAPVSGWYQIECWGAEGLLTWDGWEPGATYGPSPDGRPVTDPNIIYKYLGYHDSEYWRNILNGKGAYTKGYIRLDVGQKLYVCVGASASHFNYGGTIKESIVYGWAPDRFGNVGSLANGSGSTDIRLNNDASENATNWNGVSSRIMVAAAGGSGWYSNGKFYNRSAHGTPGGTLVSKPVTEIIYNIHYPNGDNSVPVPTGATQTSGGRYSARVDIDGGRIYTYTSGFGGPKYNNRFDSYSSGNGYYMGGGSLGNGRPQASSGGSSFISGYPGCNAISVMSSKYSIIHTGQPNHYSGMVFTNMNMQAGDTYITEPDGTQRLGHNGDGFSRILLISR